MPIGDSTPTSRCQSTGRFVRTCRGTVLQYVENKVPLALKRSVAAHRFLNKICCNEGYLSGPKVCRSNLETSYICRPDSATISQGHCLVGQETKIEAGISRKWSIPGYLHLYIVTLCVPLTEHTRATGLLRYSCAKPVLHSLCNIVIHHQNCHDITYITISPVFTLHAKRVEMYVYLCSVFN